jgi:manganese oxidase
MSTTDERDPVPATPPVDAPDPSETTSALSRRGFLRVSALAGLGATAATVAACTTAAAPSWTFPPAPSIAPAPSTSPSSVPSAAPSAAASTAPSTAPSPSPSPLPSNIPAGWTEHDILAREKVRRFIGKLAVPLAGVFGAKLAVIVGAEDDYPQLKELPEFAKVQQGNTAIEPRIDGDVKVFDLTVDEMEHRIDAMLPPIQALGYNKVWPGPVIRATEGEKIRTVFTNNLPETTSVHFHGVAFDDFYEDGVPFVTQLPITPGETYPYTVVAKPYGSLMYHSHHNATDQVGRGLLGAFIVDPADPKESYKEKYGVTQEYIWISNDSFGGFTINGHGFPATVPIIAAKGERVLVRFMNEGIMMHPWHSHGFRMKVVARDGAPLGTAAFECDTLGVNPGERWDAIIECDRIGIWAFHCHILPHVEGPDGMFGMVTALVVTPEPIDVGALLSA